jgi:AraC-like DNA-binding protein
VAPLSAILSLLKPINHLAAGLEAGGDWAIQFPDQEGGIKTGAVVSGSCWLSVEGESEPVHLNTGDCFLLPSGLPFRLASDLALPPTSAAEIFAAPRKDGIVIHNGGGDFSIVSTRFTLTGDHAGLLMRLLPAIVLVRERSDQSVLRWSIEQMLTELRSPQPGGFLVVEHLAHMMLVQTLRLHLAHRAATDVGWLFALADKQMNAVLNAMHGDPSQRWTLRSLAERAGMSRSGFAVKFRETVGSTPMEYLAKWRMLVAAERLEKGKDPISIVALSLGYESEGAFSTAFKRVMGCSPRLYVRRISGATLTLNDNRAHSTSLGGKIALNPVVGLHERSTGSLVPSD